jgi:hypothetical protein
VELGGVAADRLDHELEQAPAGEAGVGERAGHGGVAAADLAGDVAQAGPAGPVVQRVQFVEQIAQRALREHRFRQRRHGTSSPSSAHCQRWRSRHRV